MNISSQCLPLYPVIWHFSFTNKAATISTFFVIIIQLVTIPCAIFLNGVTIFLIARFEALRCERFVAIGLVSSTDLLSGLVAQPLLVAKELYHLTMKEVNCNLDVAFYHASTAMAVLSLMNLLCLTYERKVAINEPFKYTKKVTISKLLFLSGASWAGTIIFGVLYRIKTTEFFSFVTVISAALINFILFVYWNIQIFLVVSAQKKKISEQTVHMNTENGRNKYLVNRKIAITIGYLFGGFILCYLPTFIDHIYVGIRSNQAIKSSLYFTLQPWADVLVHLNSIISPLIYGIRTKELRKHFLRYFCGIRDRVDFELADVKIKPETIVHKKGQDLSPEIVQERYS